MLSHRGVPRLRADPAVHAQMIQLPATQPRNEAQPRCHSSCRAPGVGFIPNPAGKGALGRRWMIWRHCQGDAAAGAGSTYFFIIIIFLLLAARTAPGRCCHQAKAPLSWRLYGLREGGRVARWGHRMETKMRHPGTRRNTK